ncbi:MAG: RluA family pseudouridine synthase [Prochlorotrichaceae cyanobacterium]|jgi:tRNA pseudouridine32 synthase/23S rRNA pseudouridine746 synthase
MILYEGQCPRSGAWLQLPCTPAAQVAARHLMAELAQNPVYQREGKMYGVLLVQTRTGTTLTLRGFSGLLQGSGEVEGWVPPIPGRAQVALAEVQTLSQLKDLTAEIVQLQNLPERQDYAQQQAQQTAEWQALKALHQEERQHRQQHRQYCQATLNGTALTAALTELDRQSQEAGRQRRRLKALHQQAIAPLQTRCQQADDRLSFLKQRRKVLSRQLQAQMHGVYRLQNFAGDSATLQDLLPTGLPTGTGDCAAPKLLHYAASQGWHPLGLAEFWWGPPQGDKWPGEFYGPCRDRCQPLMGFLLSGANLATPAELSAPALDLPILCEDVDLIVVDKPAGLLSVPGRSSDRQDSVLSRLRCQYPEAEQLQAVHRLDQDTSGVLLLARHPLAYQALSQQFAQRQVVKHYEAIVTRPLTLGTGTLTLPLWGDPLERPRQQVNWQRGKLSISHYRVLQTSEEQSRVEFQPVTGRTHQLRVQSAHPQGLNAPILGDRLYGNTAPQIRLHLHAVSLTCKHPTQDKAIYFSSPVPF